ncbi:MULTISPECIES: HlyD family type I secretion periplasmic adaptor subunit [unclassified Pseudodesulfovibrio]|uniref:HlyD family type I secretion periplasmic adaptor subunit n=1 Tax=unclassified Pseudodesulfovibrio TaxID=2661612 RepID=UPI000FEB76D1|nr:MULTISPECIES: HlyD family type I secretion periplasmic adaptor subunit [unclassified Pseudodesulfovibrio]MCJ2163451.1 HlyD family type I secretion periplasmic adaptor subunit [Pseudodesulfovibrio sp. S3-i]RWU06686.1 HlyD family type I secretion periplasmic adaptor subunit [Pseudodesulfovibrio sp. S3]
MSDSRIASFFRGLTAKASEKAKACRPSTPSDEMEFLPASLEVVETPPSPIGRAIIWCIVAFIVFGVTWACLGKTDVVAVAQGKIIPSGRVKTIQPLERGVVSKILVQEGQIVQKGDLLIELDTTSSGADVDRLDSELRASLLEKGRITALLAWNPLKGGQPKLVAPKDADEQEVVQERIYLAQDAETLISKIRTYDNELRRLTAQKQAAGHTVDKLIKTLPIATKLASARRTLYEQDVAPENEWLQAEAQRIEVEQNLKTEQQELAEAQAAITVTAEQRVQTLSEYRRDLLERRAEVTTKIESLTQELKKAHQANMLQSITAPVAGRVQQLAVHTIGGVVTPAQPLMILVPEDFKLEVEANILNKDIGFVHEGQQVEIKLEAFPFTEYGIIDGTLRHVSSDAIQTDEGDLFYLAKVDMGQFHILVNGKKVNLSPGMRATVEVKIRERRLIEFFLSPLMKYTSESMKER